MYTYKYDKKSFKLLREFGYKIQGWGITHDGNRLIISDGSATIYFLDTELLGEVGQVRVHDENGPIERLNELEYVNGEIYANVWKTDRIAGFHPIPAG